MLEFEGNDEIQDEVKETDNQIKLNPFDFIKSINDKEYILNELNKKECIPWLINKHFSMSKETLFLANLINTYNLDTKLNYDFFYFALSKKKRFFKWAKGKDNDEVISLIKEMYDISYRKAIVASKCLNNEQIERLKIIYKNKNQ